VFFVSRINKHRAKWKKILLVVGIMVLVGLATQSMTHAQLDFPKQKEKAEQPKERLKVILKPLKQEFRLGEPIDLTLRMRNMKKELLTIIRPSVEFDLKGWVLSGEITAPDGMKRVVTSARRTPKLPDPSSEEIVRLKPREEVKLEIRFASHVDKGRSSEPWDAWTLGNNPSREGILERCFPAPGEYRIIVSVDRYTEFITVKGGGREGEVSAWRGKVLSNEVRVKVTGKNP
jgi:septum formation topological specificity factor MinE